MQTCEQECSEFSEKMVPQKPIRCDICQENIAVYSPWYTVSFLGHFCQSPKWSNNRKYQVLCPECFNAYKNFIIEHQTEVNHKKHYNDMKNV